MTTEMQMVLDVLDKTPVLEVISLATGVDTEQVEEVVRDLRDEVVNT